MLFFFFFVDIDAAAKAAATEAVAVNFALTLLHVIVDDVADDLAVAIFDPRE